MILLTGPKIYYHVLVLLLAGLFLCSSTLIDARQSYNSTAELSTSWVNSPSIFDNESSHTFSLILMRENDNLLGMFFCGFHCNYIGNVNKDCIFGVIVTGGRYLVDTQLVRSANRNNHVQVNATLQFSQERDSIPTNGNGMHAFPVPTAYPRLVWSANRNNPVQVNATLQLSQDGDLILKDPDGTLVWSTQTAGKSVAGMNLNEDGNLVLFGQNNEPIWQSFDHPTDSLLPGQQLKSGQRLTACVSASNWSEGLFYLSLDSSGLSAYVNSDPPQRYLFSSFDHIMSKFFAITREITFHYNTNRKFQSFGYDSITSLAKFITLGPDGDFNLFELDSGGWKEVVGLMDSACGQPLVCGKYGVCSDGGQCSCPHSTSDQVNFFRETHFRQPNLGCSLVTPISCDHPESHSLMELNNTYYLAFQSYEENTLVDDCKSLCLRNCSCKAALFVKDPKSKGSRKGSCSLIDEVFSIADNENSVASPYNTTLYVKVQRPYVNVKSPSAQGRPNAKASRHKVTILASVISAVLGVFCVIGSCLVYFRKRYKNIDDDFLDHVPGMPTRFSYTNLKSTTQDFADKLGEGGFGSVYAGTLTDGTKVAVKCLDGLAKVKDSFLVEVKAIGRIDHVNLVKLIGFCFEKSHRLLVYEYMANKSLDGWIFPGKEENHCLPWQTRRNIITDVAKGLTYLHEKCSKKIIHLDIKPQNILLDQHFKAKISDFGLSKLIEKDQSRVITKMRGTPGYLAPEWLSSAITEKVDVYSFGIVMLEIICGRKNVDWSRSEEDRHLLAVFKGKAEEGKLEELVDKRSEGMHDNIEEVVEMMKIAAWCLQGDFTKRPSMSLVVKVLEGLVSAETNLSYDFLNPTVITRTAAGNPNRGVAHGDSTLLPSSLSGPR